MSDGVTTQSSTLATIPASTKIATDEDSSLGHVQIIKLAISADGSGTVIPADATNGLDVDVTRVGGTVAVSNAGTFAVQVDGSALTALQLIDDPVATTASAIPSKGMAVSGTDGTNARVLKTDTSGELQVDVLTLPTATIQDGGNVISVDDGAGSLTVDNATISVVGSGTEATAQRVTIATDSTGVLSVDDNGSTLSVDDGAGSLTVDAPVATPVFVRLSDGASAITALPVTDNGGNLSIDDGGNSITVDGTVAATQSGTWTVQPGNTANSTAWKVDASSVAVPITDNSGSLTVDAPVGTPVFATITPSTTGGWTVDSRTALTSTAVAVKASAGTFGGYCFYNPNSTAVYIQIWNVASGSVTVGTTAPTYVVALPPLSTANLEITNGINHSTAIAAAATTTATGSTAPTTALTGFFIYK